MARKGTHPRIHARTQKTKGQRKKERKKERKKARQILFFQSTLNVRFTPRQLLPHTALCLQVARVLLALSTPQKHRGVIVAQGGARVLLDLARQNTDKGAYCLCLCVCLSVCLYLYLCLCGWVFSSFGWRVEICCRILSREGGGTWGGNRTKRQSMFWSQVAQC